MSSMTFDDYAAAAKTTAIPHDDPLMDKTIWVLGIAGEAGEVVEKWKKIVAYKGGEISSEDLSELEKELGDVLWYLSMCANSLGLDIGTVAEKNLQKLQDRKRRRVIKGVGDSR